jgi:hypothetical protein
MRRLTVSGAPLSSSRPGKRNDENFPWLGLGDRVQNQAGDLVEDLPSISRYHDDCERRSGYVVVGRNSGIRSDEYLELFALRGSQQLAVSQ